MKQEGIRSYLPTNESRDKSSKRKKEKPSPVNSPSNAETGSSKNLKFYFCINYRTFTKFGSEMITMINKYGDQPVSLGDRESYYEEFNTTDLQKQGKTK